MRLPLGKTGADQAHGQRVAGEYGDALGVVADQLTQAMADFQRGMAVVGQRHDGPRVLTADADEVGNAMHQHPRLAGARPGQHQRVGVFPVVGDDGALVGLGQRFDDAFPGLRRGLPFQFIFAPGQPALAEDIARQAEVIHRQLQRIGHPFDAALGILGHDVNLPGQLVVMQLQRLVIAFLELQLPVAFQLQGHRRAEDGQPLVQAQDVLFVQPEQGAVDQFVDVPVFGGEQGIAGDAGGELAQRGFSQQIDPARAAGQAGQPVGE